MEKSSLIHYSDSIYSFPISDKEIEIKLLTKKDDDIKKVELIYNDKYFFHEEVFSKVILKAYSDALYDYYVIRIKLDDVRFAYIFKITLLNDEEYYFSESGVNKFYDIKKGYYDFFQVSYINDVDVIKVNKKFANRVFYQIFVDRFFSSPQYKNDRVNINWGDKVTSKTIAGGNLKGIEEKIDYLKDLGVDALYLTPIFESESNHKYDITDYYQVSKDFGSNIDLMNLVDELHRNDILIVLDMVFNHISSKSNFFEDVIKNGKKSKYYNWFIIHEDEVDINKKNYETFGSCNYMPKLNLNNPETQDYFLEVSKYYVTKYKIDGFRLDVSDEIPHEFWLRLRYELKKIDKDFILIGENWHNSQSYLNSGKELDSIMNYALTKEMINFFAYKKTSVQDFKNNIVSLLNRYKRNVNYNLLNLLSSHDVFRFINECSFDDESFILAYAFLFVYIGIPCIYYGDEFALEGGYDPDSRRCFIWDEKSKKRNLKANSFIKKFIKLRKQEDCAEFEFKISVCGELLIVTRNGKDKVIKLIINNTNTNQIINLTGEIYSSLNLENNVLKNNGMVILIERRSL